MERSIYSQHIVDMEHSVKQLLHFGAASAIIGKIHPTPREEVQEDEV